MQITFSNDADFRDSIKSGAMEVLASPEFVRELAAAMARPLEWLTAEQVRERLQLGKSTFARWLKANRERGLIVSHALGRQMPRYRADSVQAILQASAVGELPGKVVAFPGVGSGPSAREEREERRNAIREEMRVAAAAAVRRTAP